MCQINAITRPCGANAAGVGSLWLASKDDFDEIPDADTATWLISGDITFITDKGWKLMPIAEQTADLKIELIGEADGQTIQNTIPFKLGKIRPELNKWLNDALGGRCLALIGDNNGQYILVGSLTNPLRLKGGTGGLGVKAGDFNGMEITLLNEFGVPAYFYTGAIDETFES